MIPDTYTTTRERARLDLLAKVHAPRQAPPPEAPKRDETLQEDTLALHNELFETLGQDGYSQWLEMEYPWLLNHNTPLIRVWWILQNKVDELRGATYLPVVFVQ